MKPKLLLCIALALGGGFCSQTVRAFWMTIPLNRTNITTEAPFLRIVPTRFGPTNNRTVQFSVFVLLKGKGDAEGLSGFLTVKDTQETKPYLVETQVQVKDMPERFVPAAVPKSWAGRCKVFRFEIADQLLADSEFSVNFGDSLKNMSGTGDAYVFNLKEFADKK